MSMLPPIPWAFSWSSLLWAPISSDSQQLLGLYQNASSPLSMNPVKGNMAELLLDRGVPGGFLKHQAGDWSSLTPHRSGASGIDNLFIRTSSDGRPTSVMVVESKFGTSRLGLTRDGRQMAESWIRPRLAATARDYNTAAELMQAGHHQVRGSLTGRLLAIPLGDGRSAFVVIKNNCVYIQSQDSCSSHAEIERQLRRMANYLSEVAQGQRPYQARLFRLSYKGERISFRLDQLDPSTGDAEGKFQLLQGRFDELSGEVRSLLKQSVAASLREQGVAPADAKKLAAKISRSPELLKTLDTSPTVSWRNGIDLRTLTIGALTALGTVLWQTGLALWNSRRIDWKRTAKTGAIVGVGSAVGYYASIQIQTRLITTEVGRRLIASMPLRGINGTVVAGYSSLGGGIVSGFVVAFAAYTLGLVDARQAKVMALSSSAGALAGMVFSSGAMGVAFTVGTASTGTAISTLSGAVATKAALAWIGGGALSAGGWGVAGGMAVLGTGMTVVAFGVSAGVGYVASKLKNAEREKLMIGRMTLVEAQLAATLLDFVRTGSFFTN